MELDIYITCPMQLRSKDLKQSKNAQTPNNGGTMLILQTNIKDLFLCHPIFPT